MLTLVLVRWRGWCSFPIQPNIRVGISVSTGIGVERETDRFTYSGIGVYRPAFFEGCTPGKFPLLPLFKRAIAAGRLFGELHTGEWNDVGTPQRLAELDERVGASRP